MKNKWFAGLLSGLLICSCSAADEKKPEGEKAQARIDTRDDLIEVRVEKARIAPFEMELVSNGKVEACRKAVLNFEVNDKVEKVFVKNGMRVEKDDSLVSVNSYKASCQLEDSRVGLEKARLELRSRLLSEGLEHLADTADTELLPKARFETIKLQSGYISALNAYKKALHEFRNVVVRAPFSGVVADLDAREYNSSSSYKQLCSLIDDSQMEVVFHVLETEIGNLRVGMRVDITPYAFHQHVFRGVVTEVNPRIDENGMVKVKAVADNKKGVLVDGMNVSILLRRQTGSKLIVPKSAVLPRQGKKVVFVHQGGKAIWKYVVTGLENSREVCIESGLNPGDEAIYENNLGLSHESEVTVLR